MKYAVPFLLILALSGCGGGGSTYTTPPPPPPPPTSTPHPQGVWTTQAFTAPVNPVHAFLLNTGNVLFIQGSGNCPPNVTGCPTGLSQYGATVWTPGSSTFNSLEGTLPFDLFCNGAAILPDGTVLVSGGTLAYAGGPTAAVMRAMGHGKAIPGGAMTSEAENTAGHHVVPRDATAAADDQFTGSLQSTIFNPATNKWSTPATMAMGRWYPTVTELGTGTLMTYGGQDQNANDNPLIEYWNSTGWSTPVIPYCVDDNSGLTTDCRTQFYTDGTQPIPAGPSLYPRMILLSNGKVLHAGPEPQTWLFDPTVAAPAANWLHVGNMNFGDYRTYGSVVLLPLTPTNNYASKVFVMGGLGAATGVVNATETTELLDMSQTMPAWTYGPSMSQPRVEMNAVLLPNGKVLALGGSANDEDPSTASFDADIYDPAANTFSPAGTTSFPHLYHSTALLLPDATVFITGGNPQQGSYEGHIEVYQPSYLFNSDGSLATRPTFTGAPASTSYGKTITLTTSTTVSSVVMIHDGAATHAFDMAQREIALSFTQGNGSITVTTPPNGNVAPPGYYMLFILNSNGVPSMASFIQVN